MADAIDFPLLQEYARTGSDDAFQALVDRHLNLVYSVARSRLANEAAAKDITQVVFAALARKAGHLSEKVVLSGWLFQVTTRACVDLQRAEARRKKWESEAVEQQMTETQSGRSDANDMAPMISSALAALGTSERDAILLRFFDEHDFRQVGARLGISESAAKMRVARGLEKLRRRLQRSGITISEAALCGALPQLIHSAPAGLGAAIKAGAIHAALSPAHITLLKGILKTMAWTKAKTAMVAGAVALAAVGTATIAVKEIHHHRHEVWQEKFDLTILDRVPPQVKILRSLPSVVQSGLHAAGGRNGKGLGLCQTIPDLLMHAYDVRAGDLIFAAPMPEGRYDFVASFSTGATNFFTNESTNRDALKAELKRKFGLAGRRVVIETNALVLTVAFANAPGLKPAAGEFTGLQVPGSYSAHHQSLSTLVNYLAQWLRTPVVDETGISNSQEMDIDFTWESKPSTLEGLKRALREQTGLNLMPGRRRIEFVVVEKVD